MTRQWSPHDQAVVTTVVLPIRNLITRQCKTKPWELIKPTLNKKTMFGLGAPEILLIALVVLLLFGGKKIPELMKGLGKGVKSFKDGMREVEDTSDEKKTPAEKPE